MNNEMNKMMEHEMENVSGGAGLTAQYHMIKSGETLSGIAVMYRTTVKNLMALNPQIKNPDLIFAGTRIRVY